VRSNQCKFCMSRKCHVRIVTKDYSYDEVACTIHTHKLEIDADDTLGRGVGILREHISSTAYLRRGEPC